MAGSSNIQVWDQPQTNAETDAAYAADPLRTSGAATGDICPSPTFNKFGLNVSLPIAAFCQAVANKGFTISDANYSATVAAFSNVLTTADVRTPMITVAFSTSLVFDCSQANGFQVILSSNVSSLTLKNGTFGQEVSIAFTQNGTGGFTVPWPANVVGEGAVGSTPNATYLQTFQVLGDGNFHATGPQTVV